MRESGCKGNQPMPESAPLRVCFGDYELVEARHELLYGSPDP